MAVTVTKAMGFDEEITVSSFSLPPVQGQPVTPSVSVKIPKGQNQARMEFKPPANAVLATIPEAFVARSRRPSPVPGLATTAYGRNWTASATCS